jgi:putative ABC transport system permease protein
MRDGEADPAGHAREPLVLRLCLHVLGAVARVVPDRQRAGWRQEWEAEVRHRWSGLEARRELDWRAQMSLFHRVLGCLPDAAWLRRQLTADADLVHDLRQGIRLVRRDPAFAATAVLVLGLGLGASTAVFAVVDVLLLRSLPYPDPGAIVTLWQTNPRQGDRDDVAPANFLDWRERSRSFAAIAAAVPYAYDYYDGPEPELLKGVRVTEGFFEIFGARPLLGRTLDAEDYRSGRNVLVLSHGLWKQRFGGDPAIVGRSVRLDESSWTVVGVLPPDFDPGLPSADRTTRCVWTAKRIADHERRTRGSPWWTVAARLKPGVSPREAQAEMATIARGLAVEWPRTNAGVDVVVRPLRDHLVGGLGAVLAILMAAVAVLLLITWTNLAGLLLARNARRGREMAVRSALGGSRGRLVRQLLAENMVLALLGCGLGLVAAYWGTKGIVALSPVEIPRLDQIRLDPRVIAFAAVLSAVTAVASGLLPALRLSRRGMGQFLHEGRAASGSPQPRVQRLLVAAEVALALVLLAGAGLLVQSVTRLLRVDPGFAANDVVALQVFAADRNRTPDKRARFFEETLARIESLPGVTEAGAVSHMPFSPSAIDIRTPLTVEGRPEPEAGQEPVVHLTVATPRYFDAMKIPLLRGRRFEPQDRSPGATVALVNESLARRFWNGEDPVGGRISFRLEGKPVVAEVIGVVGSVRHARLDRAAEPEVFVPHAQVPTGSMTYVVRSSGAPVPTRALQERVWSVDPAQTFSRIDQVRTLVSRSAADRRFVASLMGAFSVFALVLCALGVYGLLSFITTQRTPEIGVRLALGADMGDILRLVAGQALSLVAAGVAVGILGTLALGRFLRHLLFAVSPADPVTLAAVSAVLIATSAAACILPARRATRVDPIIALRAD